MLLHVLLLYYLLYVLQHVVIHTLIVSDPASILQRVRIYVDDIVILVFELPVFVLIIVRDDFSNLSLGLQCSDANVVCLHVLWSRDSTQVREIKKTKLTCPPMLAFLSFLQSLRSPSRSSCIDIPSGTLSLKLWDHVVRNI